MSRKPEASALDEQRRGVLASHAPHRGAWLHIAAVLLLLPLFACGEEGGYEPSKAAKAERTDGDEKRAASPAQFAGQHAEQVIQMRPGSAGPNVGLWADPNPSAVLRVVPDTAVKDSCSLTLPPGINSDNTNFEAAKGATLRLSAAGNARTSAATIRCGSSPPMRFSVVVPVSSAGSPDVSAARIASDTGLWVGLAVAVLAALAALTGLVYLLLMVSRRLASLDSTLRESARKDPSSSGEVESEFARLIGSAAEGLSRTMHETAGALRSPLGEIKTALESGNTARGQAVKHLEDLTAALVVRSSGDLAPARLADHSQPKAGLTGRERGPSTDAAPSSGDGMLPAKWTDRLQEVVKAAYVGRTRIGNNLEVAQEAKRLRKLTWVIVEASTLLLEQSQANEADPRFDTLRQALSRLRTRCEQLAGRLSELQGVPGTAAFPLTAYILPTHDGWNSVADSITTGLRESVSVLEGRTEPLTREFEQFVYDYLQPALRAANVLRRSQPDPDWLVPLVRELKLEEDRPRPGEGFAAGRHESVGGATHMIAEVYAPGYYYGDRVLLPALVRTGEAGF